MMISLQKPKIVCAVVITGMVRENVSEQSFRTCSAASSITLSPTNELKSTSPVHQDGRGSWPVPRTLQAGSPSLHSILWRDFLRAFTFGYGARRSTAGTMCRFARASICGSVTAERSALSVAMTRREMSG
jgi:hypothetical protein